MAETVRARFDNFGRFKNALARLQTADVENYEAFGPVSLTEIEPLMPRKGSRVRIFATLGAILGLIGFFYMCVKSSLIYSVIVGGKPPVSNVPFIILAYEGTILLGALAAFFSGLVLGRLSGRGAPEDYDPRLTGDMFGIDVYCAQEKCADVIQLMKDAGAVEADESK